MPRGGDGVWQVVTAGGRPCLAPDESSHYLYFTLPAELLARAAERGGSGLWLDVEYFGDRYGLFRVHYASTDRAAPVDGLYKPAEQRWRSEAAGLRRFRRALFPLPDFEPGRTQNLGASFRVEFRQERREFVLQLPVRAIDVGQVAVARQPVKPVSGLSRAVRGHGAERPLEGVGRGRELAGPALFH